MVRIDEWTERLSESKGGLLRIVTAHWNDKKRLRLKKGKMDVIRERVDGSFDTRGILEFSFMAGYSLSNTLGWKTEEAKIWEKIDKKWYKRPSEYDTKKKKGFFGWTGARTHCSTFTEKDEELILKHYPDFKWTLMSVKERFEGFSRLISLYGVWRLLQNWTRMPEVELLYKAGYEELAYSIPLTKKSDKQKKKIVAWLRKANLGEEEKKHLNYGAAAACAKGKSYEDYVLMKTMKIDKDLLEYYKDQKRRNKDRKGEIIEYPQDFMRLYKDYMRMLKNSEHDENDKYWRWPKNLYEFHERLLNEEQKKKDAAQKEKIKKLEKVLKKWKGKEITEGGLRVYVPETRNEILTQAKVLHQCLVVAGYDMRMAEGELTLVFISREGKPAATAEIFNNAKLGQFFGDEGAGWGDTARPKEDEVKALEKWRSLFFNKPLRPKNKRNKHVRVN